MKRNSFILFIFLFCQLEFIITSHAQNEGRQLSNDTMERISSSTFAMISDYGSNSANEAAVANLVKSWRPKLIITAGDNNYPAGDSSTIDVNVGKYYHEYIKPYSGVYGSGAFVNSFFPTLGNHDVTTSNGTPYLQYFTLPGNERYYDFVNGNVHFFAINSNPSEPDGTSNTSTQATWLKNKLAVSTSKWKIVYFHHSPFASDIVHGNQAWMQWPFKSCGADVVLSGNSHVYERIIIDNFPYIVNGLGGRSIYGLNAVPIAGSQIRYNKNYGALKVTVISDSITFRFYNVFYNLIDSFTLVKEILQIKETEASSFLKVFPNPNNGNFTIALKMAMQQASKIKVIIADGLGHTIYNKEFVSGNEYLEEIIELDKSLPEGVYSLQTIIGNKVEKIHLMLLK